LLALSDEELLVHYRETGERECFAELVSRYERELFSYLKRYLGSIEAAEDAFQASFLQVHLKANQFEPERRFRPWLYAIATNQAIDAQRRNRRTRTVSLDGIRGREDRKDVERPVDWMVSPEPSPAVEVDHGERNELMRRALEHLSDQMRTVIHLVYYQGLKYREAAEVMAVPVGTIKSRLHTAIAKLTEFWNHHHAEAD
jgi:RNA polymerase sigma-70 factor (ECF subfamily)